MLTVHAPGTQKRNFTHVFDIIDGLVRVGDSGLGDDFGIGDHTAYSVLDVAQMFGGEIQMTPEVAGNRMLSDIDTSKTELLGWSPKYSLTDYIEEIRQK